MRDPSLRTGARGQREFPHHPDDGGNAAEQDHNKEGKDSHLGLDGKLHGIELGRQVGNAQSIADDDHHGDRAEDCDCPQGKPAPDREYRDDANPSAAISNCVSNGPIPRKRLRMEGGSEVRNQRPTAN